MQTAEEEAVDQRPAKEGEAADSTQPNSMELQALQAALTQIDQKRSAKEKYAFWETQPVSQFTEEISETMQDGPIDKPKTVEEVKQDPYGLPASFEWSICNFSDDATVDEVYKLLCNNYVEDDDNMFRFNYSSEFLRWALQPPGSKKDWLLGVRVASTKKLVGFISAVPAHIRARQVSMPMVEINFLCVHKKLRHKRLAPVLIKEITRRVNLTGVWQAAYTAGVLIPRPISTARYWHRSINPKKLIDIGFSRLAPRMTMARTIKLYKLPDTPATPKLRALEERDVPQVTKLLNDYLAQFVIAPVFTEDEVKHWFSPQHMVIDAYVVEDAEDSSKITDFTSFYTLPSSILGHKEHTELRAAYSYYSVPGKYPLKQLVNDAMIMARDKGYDVFNALNLMQNADILKDLKFGIGDGNLHYYLYNWRIAATLAPGEVGLVLM